MSSGPKSWPSAFATATTSSSKATKNLRVSELPSTSPTAFRVSVVEAESATSLINFSQIVRLTLGLSVASMPGEDSSALAKRAT